MNLVEHWSYRIEYAKSANRNRRVTSGLLSRALSLLGNKPMVQVKLPTRHGTSVPKSNEFAWFILISGKRCRVFAVLYVSSGLLLFFFGAIFEAFDAWLKRA